ncbi:hypothetical protein O6H91_23G009300 [Diphasiastrum complanatum]|uniref:Uncharacterized protein n=3 Tax=Diphasiastrum complanatum TaxID=34168 RepID=A0ACC2A7W9_DIPCM|nr:hypothetical protein O6H91_23G008300 [Diphasiastrum complanatum]KAJ7513642.1 hypothetical protein O6H91_23G008300 [Diphasiastrum complanatum]KAJ7513661.1 hypothetical protein O6H91_23G009300 [Diphasiastrum complanatum]
MAEHYGGHPGSPDSSFHSDNESGGHQSGSHDHSFREQDRLLPIANVGRIMKKALPANAKISKDAKETVQECVSEFISFITGEASDKCQREKRKTINGDDLMWAMSTLGFEDYVEPLKVYLQKYREMEGERTTTGKQGEKENGNLTASMPAPMQMMQQVNSYGQAPPNLVYGQQMMAPYQLGSGSSSMGGTGGGSVGHHR